MRISKNEISIKANRDWNSCDCHTWIESNWLKTKMCTYENKNRNAYLNKYNIDLIYSHHMYFTICSMSHYLKCLQNNFLLLLYSNSRFNVVHHPFIIFWVKCSTPFFTNKNFTVCICVWCGERDVFFVCYSRVFVFACLAFCAQYARLLYVFIFYVCIWRSNLHQLRVDDFSNYDNLVQFFQ